MWLTVVSKSLPKAVLIGVASLCLSSSLNAEAATTIYGFDFSKHYADPTDRTIIMADMLAALKQAKEVTYKTTDEEAIKLWIYPAVDSGAQTADEKRPAIVFIHGGGWGGGHAAYFAPQAIYFAQRGMVAVTINYRLTRSLTESLPKKIRKKTESTIEDCVRDGKSALRWLRNHADDYHIDHNRIIVAGGSAGAHIAMCLTSMDTFNNPEDDLAISPQPDAMILFNPAIDFVDSEDGRKIGLRQAERLSIPLEQLSPAHLVNEQTPPTLILSGENDGLIPPPLVHKVLDRMRAHNRPARFVEYTDASHGFFNFWPAYNPYFASTIEAADTYLIELGYLRGEPNVKELIHWYQDEPETNVYKNRK